MSDVETTVTVDTHAVQHRGVRSHLPGPEGLVFWTWVGYFDNADDAITAAQGHARRYPGATIRVVHEVTTVTRTEVLTITDAGDEVRP